MTELHRDERGADSARANRGAKPAPPKANAKPASARGVTAKAAPKRKPAATGEGVVMEDGAARGEAGDLTEQIDRLVSTSEPVDWSGVERLADQLAKLATEQPRP